MKPENNNEVMSLFSGCSIAPEIINKIMATRQEEYLLQKKSFGEEQIHQEEEKILKMLSCEVSLDKQYPENQFLYEVDGKPFLTRGDIHTIGGKQKGGKSSLARIIMAATLSGSWYRIKCLTPGIETVYIDTEMKGVDTQNSLRQIAKMAGVEESELGHIHMYNVRPLTTDEIKESIILYLELHHPTLMFIDGLVDLCKDFNDVEASQDLVLNFLMKKAEEYNCAIVSMLHTNKTDNYTELRGHLGAFLEQKGVSVIKCIKDEKSGIVTVTMPTVRYAPVPDWHFAYDACGCPIDAESLFLQHQEEAAKTIKERKEAERRERDQSRKDAILSIINANAGHMLRKDVQEAFCTKTKLGETVFKDLVKSMLESEPAMLYQSGQKGRLVLSSRPIETIPGL